MRSEASLPIALAAIPVELSSRLQVAIKAALEGGMATLQYFRRPDLAVETKRDGSPVSTADRETEKLIRRIIDQDFPEDGVLGEELDEKAGTSGFRWILDPIDGTRNYIKGLPLYGTMIGLERGSDTVVGALALPALGECLYAAKGGGAWYVMGGGPPRRAKVSSVDQIRNARICTADVDYFARSGRLSAYHRIKEAMPFGFGPQDCYAYALVATGRADVMIDPKMAAWDCAALKPIIEEAGGSFTDWRGNSTIYGGDSVAANPQLIRSILELLH